MIKAGVIGNPIEQSLSPLIHGHWIEHYGLSANYDAIQVGSEELHDKIKTLADKGFSGVNVTIPHKETVYQLCDSLTDTALKIGAVNILIFKDGKFVGGNSDAFGFWMNFVETIRQNGRSVPDKGCKFLLLGAGGAARAVLYALKKQGYRHVLIANRSIERAEKLSKGFGWGNVLHWEDRFAQIKRVDCVINSTSLGMTGQPFLFVANAIPNFKRNQIAYDLVYKPLETQLLKGTKIKKAVAVYGLGMLLYQAVPSFEAFFGLTPTVTDNLKDRVLDRLKALENMQY